MQRCTFLLISSLLLMMVSCRSTRSEYDAEIEHGVIAYPFHSYDQPLGVNQPERNFIIRSVVGQTEYAIEIPGAAEHYDIELPLADLGGEDGSNLDSAVSTTTTDLELQRGMPPVPASPDKELVRGAFGLGEVGGPVQGPSYTLGLSRINQHYLKRQYEHALLEINELLNFYPTSVQLFKMKGTILRKMRNFNLARDAWQRALDLEPNNAQIRAALESMGH